MDFTMMGFFQLMAPLVLAALIILLSFVGLSFLEPKYDQLEPPRIPQKIPFLGHLLGLIRHGLRYYDRVR